MHMIRIVVAVLLLFVAAITKVHCNSFSTKFKTRITSYETIIETITVPTFVACARECTRDDCCTACYNKATNKCHLHGDCFPVSEHSDSGVFIRKNDVKTSNDATTQDTTRDRTTLENTSDKPTTNYQTPYKESDDLTTTMKQTVRDITGNFKTTRDKRSTAATIERKTENRTVAMIIDCSEIRSGSLSGIYTIYVENQANDVYCEMRGDGQWTASTEELDSGLVIHLRTKGTLAEVIQRRLDGTTDFYRNWHEYKQGFGNVNLEYWLGNDNLHKILSAKNYKLRIDLEDWNGNAKFADYNTFVVGSEDTNYTLTISGYSGDAGDSIINPPSGSIYQMYGMEFSTSDRDNDKNPFHKAAESKRSGWWLKWSTDANLNGVYYTGGQIASDGIFWKSWQSSQYSLKSVSMKIKPS